MYGRRARENRAVAELELMSSTSHEVCELWNGQQIVRVFGSPKVCELLSFPQLQSDNLNTTSQWQLHRLQSGMAADHLKNHTAGKLG